MAGTAMLLLGLLLGAPQVIDLVTFRPGSLAEWERFERTSDSRPLTLDELEKLANAGVGHAALEEMMRTRKVLALADADALLRLKKAGASDAILTAVSAYAVAPNDGFDLHVHLDVRTPYSVREAPFVYIELHNIERDRQDAFLHSDLRGLLRGGGAVEVVRDRSDPLLPAAVRRVRIHGPVRTRDAGPLELRVLVTQLAGLRSLRDLPPAEKAALRTHRVDYPAVSLDSRCRLEMTLQRDPLLRDRYSITGDRLECRWD